MAKTFIKSFLCIQILLSPAYAPALAQTGAANGAAEIAFADAIGDSLLRSYSVDELLRFKNFYESERSQLEKERQLLREKGIRDLEGFLRNHPESSVLDKVIFRLAELYYEQAENDYLAAQEDYGRALELHDAGEVQQLPPEPQKILAALSSYITKLSTAFRAAACSMTRTMASPLLRKICRISRLLLSSTNRSSKNSRIAATLPKR